MMIRKPATPSTDQFGTAIEWLNNNEGDGAEGEACRAVAAWLEWQEQERSIRYAARRSVRRSDSPLPWAAIPKYTLTIYQSRGHIGTRP